MQTQLITPEARKAILVGRSNHWRFRVLGQGDMPAESFYKDQWVFEPHTTVPNIPKEGYPMLDALRRSGVHFKGYVIAHEAPRLLAAPKEAPKPDVKKTPDILPATQNFDFFVMLLPLIFELLFRVVLLDPALIVVLEDGTWLQVMTWYED